MFVIGIAGGSGSGKTTLVNSILEKIPSEMISVLPQDAYYNDSSHLPLEERKKINFDHPNSIEWDLLLKDIIELKKGNKINRPTYSFITCSRLAETVAIEPTKILLVEGILIFTQPQICEQLDMCIYLEVEPDQRLSRIIERDMATRERTAQQVIKRYYETVRPMHEEFIKPSREQADMLVMGGGLNVNATDFISSAILGKIGI